MTDQANKNARATVNLPVFFLFRNLLRRAAGEDHCGYYSDKQHHTDLDQAYQAGGRSWKALW